MHRRTLLSLAPLPLLSPFAAQALNGPEGPVMLTVYGKVRDTNRGSTAVFDLAMLEHLPQASFIAHTPWYPQAHKFSGPLLRDVVAAAGGYGSQLRAVALNDYRVDLPLADAQHYDLLLARLLDDKPMAVRDKGPLFIIYPFDQHAELRNSVYHSRCAWQLKAIELL
jgi:hypothetical protein